MDSLVESVKCKHCSCEVILKQKFCSECGNKVLAEWFCAEPAKCEGFNEDGTVCGQPLDLTAKFCVNCGKKNPRFARNYTADSAYATESLTPSDLVSSGDVISGSVSERCCPEKPETAENSSCQQDQSGENLLASLENAQERESLGRDVQNADTSNAAGLNQSIVAEECGGRMECQSAENESNVSSNSSTLDGMMTTCYETTDTEQEQVLALESCDKRGSNTEGKGNSVQCHSPSDVGSRITYDTECQSILMVDVQLSSSDADDTFHSPLSDPPVSTHPLTEIECQSPEESRLNHVLMAEVCGGIMECQLAKDEYNASSVGDPLVPIHPLSQIECQSPEESSPPVESGCRVDTGHSHSGEKGALLYSRTQVCPEKRSTGEEKADGHDNSNVEEPRLVTDVKVQYGINKRERESLEPAKKKTRQLRRQISAEQPSSNAENDSDVTPIINTFCDDSNRTNVDAVDEGNCASFKEVEDGAGDSFEHGSKGTQNAAEQKGMETDDLNKDRETMEPSKKKPRQLQRKSSAEQPFLNEENNSYVTPSTDAFGDSSNRIDVDAVDEAHDASTKKVEDCAHDSFDHSSKGSQVSDEQESNETEGNCASFKKVEDEEVEDGAAGDSFDHSSKGTQNAAEQKSLETDDLNKITRGVKRPPPQGRAVDRNTDAIQTGSPANSDKQSVVSTSGNHQRGTADKLETGYNRDDRSKDKNTGGKQGDDRSKDKNTGGKQGAPAVRMPMSAGGSRLVRVHFHVVINTSEFHFKAENDFVEMRFSLPCLGEWTSMEHRMKVEKIVDNKHLLMHMAIDIDKSNLLKGSKPFLYKYVVQKKDGFIFENIPSRSGEIVNRRMHVLEETLAKSSEWHQYDGKITPTRAKGFVANIKSELKKWTSSQPTEQTMLAAKAMLPAWDELYSSQKDRRAERFLEKVNQVCYCIKTGCFVTEDYLADSSKITEVLLDYIGSVIDEFQKIPEKINPEDKRDGGLCLAFVCCVLYIVYKYKLTVYDTKAKSIFMACRINPQRGERVCADYQQLRGIYFIEESWIKEISISLLEFVCRNPYEVASLLAIPLLHFLTGESQPYESSFTDFSHQKPDWWGIGKMDKFISSFKYNNEVYMPLGFYLEQLSPLFEADYLLPRTLLSVMSFKHIPTLIDSNTFPPYVLVANIFYFVKSRVASSSSSSEVFVSIMDKLTTKLDSWIQIPAADEVLSASRLEKQKSEAVLCCVIARDLMNEVCDTSNLYTYQCLLSTVRVFASAISNVQKIVFEMKSDNSAELQAQDLLKRADGFCQSLCDITKRWLIKVSPYSLATWNYRREIIHDERELLIYSSLMRVKFSNSVTNVTWKKVFGQLLYDRLGKVDGHLRINLLCSIDFKQYASEVEECFSRAAFEVLEDSSQSRSTDFSYVFDAAEKTHQALKIRGLLCRLFDKAWPDRVGDENDVFLHILTWRSFTRFVGLFYGKAQVEDLLSETCRERLLIAVSVYEKVIQDLVSGSISVKTLNLLSSHKDSFIEIFRLTEKTGLSSTPLSEIEGMGKVAIILKVIAWRQKELHSFGEVSKRVQNFCNLCPNVESDDLKELERLLSADLESMRIDSFCVPCIYSDEAAVKEYEPTITYFKLDRSFQSMLEPLMNHQRSIIFRQMWSQSLLKLQAKMATQSLTTAQIVSSVWDVSSKTWMRFCTRIRSGEVTFVEIENCLNCLEKRREMMEKELSLACGDTAVAKKRLEQIEQYYRLSECSDGAKVMLDLRSSFELTGNFNVVEVLVNLVNDKRQPLNCITKELIESGEALKDITRSKVDCLKVFQKNKKFADWLKKSLRGPKEVKVLVDLAMISAQGQDDLEVTRVSCLHAAATGYAPLIYDIQPEMGFKEFLPLCQAVWRTLEVDDQLPKKFRDTARHLEWLNRIKDSHGSVEVNALAHARAINEGGIYTVGNLNAVIDKKQTLDQVLLLKLRLSRGEVSFEDGSLDDDQAERQRWQTMSLQQLNDLQSKLMLVAGKALEGKEQVDQFVEVFDGVTRLGNLYVRICNAGCTLFQHWKAIFYCNTERKQDTRVEFGKDNSKHVLKGSSLNSGDGVLQDLRDLCKFMEECLEKWLYHISSMRTDSYYLNNFTTEQLVILQNELAKVNSAEKTTISPKLYALLSGVQTNCTLRNLERAMRLAFQELAEMNQTDSETVKKKTELKVLDETMDVEVDDDSAQTSEAVEHCIQDLIDAGYSKKLAKEAIKAVGVSTEEATLWCMERCDESEDEAGTGTDESFEEDMKSNDGVDDEASLLPIEYKDLHLQITKESLTMDLFKKIRKFKGSLLHRLGELWNVYQQEMNTSVADYLSLLHLGLVLKHLAHMEKVPLNRPLPVFLKKDKPNLIVCTQAEVLTVVISLYMYNEGANLSLPGTDEVLVCDSNTTVEDVELLWRRMEGDARNKWHGKIYTLVHAELLDYDISHKVEQSLEKHCHALDDMRLVVVCCREMEDRCHMISALDRFRVKVTPLSLVDINRYLKDHFTVGATHGHGGLSKTDASVDAERCCVRVIKSHRAGVGKTLKVKRLCEQLRGVLGKTANRDPLLITVPLHCRTVNQSTVLQALLPHVVDMDHSVPRIFHIDIAHEVLEGVDNLLFNLLVLGSITDRTGYVWTRSSRDLYIIETMPLMQREVNRTANQQQLQLQYVHNIFELLPTLTCWSPRDSLEIIRGQVTNVKERYTNAVVDPRYDQTMDRKEFESAMFQRPFQYLQRFNQGQELRGIRSDIVHGDPEQCIDVLLQNCKLRDPSWSELRHFVNFLNVQLISCEKSIFCSEFLAPDLPGFLNFVVQFMMQMSKDFAMRSLKISEETPEVAVDLMNEQNEEGQNVLQFYALDRRWETSPHPYLFFNNDRSTFTFMGFIINPQTGDIMEPTGSRVLTPQAMARPLQDALIRNRANLSENFDLLARIDKIDKMCQIMGIDMVHDPDPTYELTADNVKKMMAIYMRFRCGIPVIIMGETGCGKTRLIKFMCDLWKPPGAAVSNMILMKVHGGTSSREIERTVKKAVERARDNSENFPGMQTVLFFDEANTTEDIGLIKEIMCDLTIKGVPLSDMHELKLIAACNPYRKHSNDMIDRLEHAGLGYHVDANQTVDKLGRIPMRQLVYRVQALPQSMLPLVWDFGQLSTDVERLYIRQMVNRYIQEYPELKAVPSLGDVTSTILAASQEFMRQQKDECSFVSLRDVDRTLQVMMWFYNHKDLFQKIDAKAHKEQEKQMQFDDELEDDGIQHYESPSEFTLSLLLALGVCYHACLDKRQQYREFIANYFTDPCTLSDGAKTILENISWCQDVFLDEIELGANIAKNQALKENVFMMVICIELRIPLFLVGKPGSSKSLAKTIVADAMQGEQARSDLYRTLKSVHMVSYQCSPLSTPEGIVGTFSQCAKLQEKQDLAKFVSVVVLDEVGLAEDSPRMPLKTLHPLLEDGCEGDEEPLPYKKVGFIGISNWALDPAKMNRGILVQRGVPDDKELEQSALGICGSNKVVRQNIEALVPHMAKAYLELYKSALEIREFFGLRDFYSLIKMVCGFATKRPPSWHELQHAILRNFGGLDTVKPIDVFNNYLKHMGRNTKPKRTDPPCDPASLIRSSLSGDRTVAKGLDSESRYLLILTENYAALGILQQELLNIKDAIIIFGSSFPRDQEYTQVCRNINRIKVCMETGQTVVLLNLENLYESLYDALNQYYIKFGDQRFVDLGLGTQRVKCRVHQHFRLIVVAEKKVVIEKFPIPLINRLEKHFLAMDTMLTPEQRDLSQRLHRWTEEFCSSRSATLMSRQADGKQPKVGDVFIGYHTDTAASVILQVSRFKTDCDKGEQLLDKAKKILLCCATPESIVRLRGSPLAATHAEFCQAYFNELHNDDIFVFMRHALMDNKPDDSLFIQITTHSHLLVASMAGRIAKYIGFKKTDVVLHSLQAFDTEQQFCKMLKDTFSVKPGATRLLMLQCDSGDFHADLIACARYNISNEYSQSPMNKLQTASGGDSELARVHVAFIIQLPRIAGGCFVGFQGGRWTCHHIDDLHPSSDPLPPLAALEKHSISSLFEAAVKHADGTNSPVNPVEEEMDVESAETEQEIEIVIGDTIEMDVSTDAEDANATVLRNRKQQVCEGLRFSRGVMSGDAACIGSGSEVLDVDGIIRKCIHHALIMLKDKDECRQRSSIRLQLLLNLLNESSLKKPDELDLISVLRRRIAMLLRDKEDTVMHSGAATTWLCNEAASFQNVNQAGFFRKAVWQYLESRVTPMLAGILAYADSNKNLDLLRYAVDNKIKWMQDLWLDLLDSADVTSVKYSDLQTAMRGTELTDFEVKIFGSNSFNPRLPFSYIIKERVEAMVYAAKNQRLDESKVTFVNRLLDESRLGKILLKATDAAGVSSEINDRYVHDFVRMSYKTQSEHFEEEFQLVRDDLILEARSQVSSARQADAHANDDTNIEDGDEESQMFTENSIGFTIPSLHFAFTEIRGRLNLFAQLAQTLPDSVKKMAANGKDIKMPLDILSLIFLTEWLAPGRDELNNANSRHAWTNRVRSLGPLVLCLLDSVTATTSMKYEIYHKQCRCAWNRICALQLFIVHVCPPDSKQDQLSVKKCMPLWTYLGEKTDFKTDHSLLSVERFLKVCNGNARETFFGKDKCPHCKETIEGPVKLPCAHILCLKCVEERKQLDLLDCPADKCDKRFAANFKAVVIADKKEAMNNFQTYKQRCNAFFMDLVCRLCFTDSPTSTDPPEPEAVKRLMGYITCKSKVNEKIKELKGQKTKKMGVFDDALDPTPVVRSFLLQLLLRSDIDQVRDYLQNFFEDSRLLLGAESNLLNELSLLCVQCLEDHYMSQQAKIPNELEQIKYTKKCLKTARHGLLNVEAISPHIETLEAVANARFGLMSCATWLNRRFITKDFDRRIVNEVGYLCDEAEKLCTRVRIKWPRVYLMRQIMRQFGMDPLRQIGAELDGRWVIPPEARGNENDVAPDRFIVCGDQYKQLRELVAEVVLGKSTKALTDALTKLGRGDDVQERDMLLAIYREITSYAGQADRQTPPQILQHLSDWCRDSTRITNKPLAEALVRNTLTDELQVTPNGAPLDRALAEAVVHFKILMHGALENGLTQPLLFLIQGANDMANAYLPTMPQDDLEDVKEAMLAARTANENPTFFQCPNGHPYVIGNCGRPAFYDNCRQCGLRIGGQGYVLDAANRPLEQPMEQTQCRYCGAAIGGTNHNPLPGNTVLNRADATPTGHVLGTPQLRQPIPERDMSAASTAVLRLLLHMSMYLGATKDPQQVGQLIRPPVDNVLQFLWSHMRFDLDTIHSAIGRSVDDVLVLVHVLLVQAIGIQYQNYGGDARLTTKQSRRTWENVFTNSYIAPVLQQLDHHLQSANNSLVNDNRLGNNALIRMLYEVDVSNIALPQQQQSVIEVPSMWRYRERISLQHAQMSLNKQSGIKNANGKKKKKQLHPYPVLLLFFREECHLQALRMLPSIVRLHHLLVLRYNRSIDHAEATSMTIQQFLDGIKDDNLKQEFSSLIEDFQTAWNLVHDSLINYVFDQNGRTLPANYAQQTMNKGSPLAQLLPSMRGYGVCSIALVCFLCKKQNDFLEQYSLIRQQTLENYVGIFDAINAHLIAFSRERDLQPIVLANCNYSLEVGQGTRVEYDFETMERQIEERFIRGRPGLTYQCEFIFFREDVTNAAIFSQLRHRIPQEPLTNVAVIEKELQQKLTDVNDLLANLDIAVGFLVSITNDADESLSHFMTISLRMKLRRELAETIQSCRLKHVEALWVQLSFMRACMQDTYQQDPFDGIEEKYRDEIPEDLVKTLLTSLQHVDLDVFLRSLYECILFRIAVKQDTNAEDYVDNAEHPLNYVLNEFIEQKDNGIAIPALTDKRFPEEFKVKHCISIWRRAHLHQTKSSGRRHR